MGPQERDSEDVEGGAPEESRLGHAARELGYGGAEPDAPEAGDDGDAEPLRGPREEKEVES